MSSVIKIGLVGCGNIVTGHLHGFKILRENGFDNFRITALCDQRVNYAQMFLCAGMGAKGDTIFDGTPWRDRKLQAGGGFPLDAGVHRFSHVSYLCGEIAQVSAIARRNEPVRVLRDANGRVTERIESELEDAYFAHLEFESGAIGSIAEGLAGHGEATGLKDGPTIYGTKGCLKGGQVTLDSGWRAASRQLFNAEAPLELKERQFPLGTKDRFSLNHLDFLPSIAPGQPRSTDGHEGMRDLACSFSVLESSTLNQPVRVADVGSGKIDAYHRSINAHYGI